MGVTHTTPTPRARVRPRWWRLPALGLLALAAVEYGVLPNLVAARHHAHLVASASVWFLAVAVLAEAASLVCYTGLTRAVLPPGVRMGWPTQLAIDLTGYGAGHVLPGGGATAAALRFRLMTSAGVDAGSATTTTAVQVTLSDLALAACYLLGAVTAIQRVEGSPELALAALGGVVVIAGGVVVWGRVTAGSGSGVDAAGRGRGRLGIWVTARWDRMQTDVREFLRDDTRTIRAVAYAVANWLLDAGCLWLCLRAYGDPAAPGLVLTAYGFACLLGLLPLTPGGLGVIEGTLIPLLIAFGTTSSTAVLGVLTWRLLQFWLPVPVAAACYLGLRLSGRLGRPAEGALW